MMYKSVSASAPERLALQQEHRIARRRSVPVTDNVRSL